MKNEMSKFEARELLARVHALNFPVTVCPAGKTTAKDKIVAKGKKQVLLNESADAEAAPKKTPMPLPNITPASQLVRVINAARPSVDQVLQATFGQTQVA